MGERPSPAPSAQVTPEIGGVIELVRTVFSGLSALVIQDVEDAGEVIGVAGTDPGRCPPLPWLRGGDRPGARPSQAGRGRRARDGRRVTVTVKARRMRCPIQGCPRQTFREQVPGVLERYQRRTPRLAGHVAAVTRELAGRVSVRILSALGVPLSRNSTLRRTPPLTYPNRLNVRSGSDAGPPP